MAYFGKVVLKARLLFGFFIDDESSEGLYVTQDESILKYPNVNTGITNLANLMLSDLDMSHFQSIGFVKHESV